MFAKSNKVVWGWETFFCFINETFVFHLKWEECGENAGTGNSIHLCCPPCERFVRPNYFYLIAAKFVTVSSKENGTALVITPITLSNGDQFLNWKKNKRKFIAKSTYSKLKRLLRLKNTGWTRLYKHAERQERGGHTLTRSIREKCPAKKVESVTEEWKWFGHTEQKWRQLIYKRYGRTERERKPGGLRIPLDSSDHS